MNINRKAALVTGGASGLGAHAVRELAGAGVRVTILDVNMESAESLAHELGCFAVRCDISDSASVARAIAAARSEHGSARIVVNCTGTGGTGRVVRKDGKPMELDDFSRVIQVNLVGTFDVIRQAAADMLTLEPMADGERGVIISTASIAAYEGQIGQAAYAASKGGLVSMTLPLARDLAQYGVRVMTIAPGLFMTPLMQTLPGSLQESLAASVPFPRRLGKPEEFAALVLHVAENLALNGEVIRLDGALRLAPR